MDDPGGLTLTGLRVALDRLDPDAAEALADWPVVAHNPGTQTWNDVVGLYLDRERERIVLRLRGRA